jgi:enoyl-CoA hydratase/carnithine racemase
VREALSEAVNPGNEPFRRAQRQGRRSGEGHEPAGRPSIHECIRSPGLRHRRNGNVSRIPAFLNAPQLLEELRGSYPVDRSGAAIVSIRPGDPSPDQQALAHFASLPFVLIAVGDITPGSGWHELADLTVEEGDDSLDDVVAMVAARPHAATALALLLRGAARRGIGDGLVAESAVYSTLQAGPEFASWRTGRPVYPPSADDGRPRVSVERAGSTLHVTLTRPDRLNSLDVRMRDELLDALSIARADPDLIRVELRGEGRAFSAGGDLNEFGSRSDPATAHLIRLQRSVARSIDALAARTSAYVHGPCVGSGIELVAFAHTVVARSDTVISLPEVSLGLIPGAGGTVSLPRRIGRQRTAWLALSGRTIDAGTALEWGLVDALDEEPPPPPPPPG